MSKYHVECARAAVNEDSQGRIGRSAADGAWAADWLAEALLSAAPGPALLPGDVHLWLARLDPPASVVARCTAVLTDAERSRRRAFRFEADRRRSIVARALLRTLLARYTGDDPREVELGLGEHGKPRLASSDWPQFNLAHSAEWVLMGFSDEVLGVDVEDVVAFDAMSEVAARFFSPLERRVIASVPDEERLVAFYRCWTMKEAYLKGRGDGLYGGLDSFSVAPDRPSSGVLAHTDLHRDASRWKLESFSLDDRCIGAAAIVRESAERRLMWCGHRGGSTDPRPWR
jgi:4'-phosphopantetheinyl transferase